MFSEEQQKLIVKEIQKEEKIIMRQQNELNLQKQLTIKDVKSTSLEKYVTTKELAEVLGVDVRTIQLTVKRLESANILSHLKTKSVRGGQTYVFTEQQTTLIK